MCASSPSRTACSPEARLATILVTGFEPFGGETVNASWEAAKRLEGWRCGDHVAVALMLPCVYGASVDAFVETFERLRPDAALMTGQAARRGLVCVERFARNVANAATPDNRGVVRARRRPRSWARATRGDSPGRGDRARDPRRGRSGARIDERRRLCLQPSLLRRAGLFAASLARDAAQCSFICRRRPSRVRRARIRAGFRRPTQSAP